MQAATLISAEEFDLLAQTDERRLEFMDGEVIELSFAAPIHSVVVRSLFLQLEHFASKSRMGVVLSGNKFQIGDSYRFIPDLVFLTSQKFVLIDLQTTPVDIVPDLAVEVISPSETAFDVDTKIAAYLEAGVQEVWTIYPHNHRVHIESATANHIFRSHDTLRSDLFPGWSTPIASLFSV